MMNRRLSKLRNEIAPQCKEDISYINSETMKNITIVDPVVTIKSTLKESDIPNLEALADAML